MATSLAWQLQFEERERSLGKLSRVFVLEPHTEAKPQRKELVSHDLLQRIARGDETALSALYDRASRVVFGMAQRILRNEAEAEEIVLEVFLQVWRKAGDFDPDRGAPTGWLLMVTRSRVIDRVRANKLKREREQPLEGIEEPANGDNPEAQFATGQLFARVREGLVQLPWEQRQAIEMAYLQGFSQSEIADRLRIPLGTIKTRIRTGMQRIQNLMGVTPRKRLAR